MTDEQMVEAEIVRVLEQKPAVTVPADFAAKVRAALPAQKKVRAARFGGRFARRSLGRTVAVAAVGGLVVGLCLLAPHARPSFESVAFDVEMVMLLELGLVGAWLGRAGTRE